MLLTEFKFYSDVVSAGSGNRSRSFWNDGTYKRWFLYYVLLSISLAVIFLNFGKPKQTEYFFKIISKKK